MKPEYHRMLEDEMLKYSGLYQPKTLADLVVVSQIFSDGRPISLPVSTCYKAFTTRWKYVLARINFVFLSSFLNFF